MICFHCANPVPPELNLWVVHQGQEKPVCCHGCQAVAQAILAGGFEKYYQQRSVEATRAPSQSEHDELKAYDDPGFLEQHAHRLPDGTYELLLLVEGLRCAACVWLNEEAVRRLPGVRAFHLNLTTERAGLQFDPGTTPLSAILTAMRTIGYRAWPFNQERAAVLDKNQQQRLLRQVFVAGIAMMQVMMFAAPWYFAAPEDVDKAWQVLLRWASLLLTIPVMLYSAAPIFDGAWRDLRHRRIGMDVPVVIALVAAFAASTWATIMQRGEVYFDSITMFVFLLLGTRYLEKMVRQRAARSLGYLLRAVPQQLTRIGSSSEERIPISAINVGDRVRFRAGETLALDARLLSPYAQVNLALLTGESLPVLKHRGDVLPAGAVNVDQPIEAVIEHLAPDSFVASMERLIERAGRDRPRLQKAADRVAVWFLSGLLGLTLLITGFWCWFDPARALPIAIAVLVVSCPCALSLATPSALAAATAKLARKGLLITRGDALEKLTQMTDIAFDKTGTLTESRPTLQSVTLLSTQSRSEVLAVAAALEAQTQHPFGQALLSAAAQDGLSVPQAHNVTVRVGEGVQGEVGGIDYRLGRRAFVSGEEGCVEQQVWLAHSEGCLAAFSFDVSPRTDILQTLQALQARGLELHLLSGDGAEAVQRLATQFHLSDARGGLSPEQKLQQVREWQSQGKVVAMVGDGINDAPVLAGADVSIAMGDGTDLAQISADAVLINGALSTIAEAVITARYTRTIMKQNLAWASLYNALAIPAAALGYVSPLVAAIGMSTSSLFVVLNAARLLKMN